MRRKTYLRLVERQEEQARRHLDEVRGIYKEMRGYKHDFHYHLQALKGQLEAGQTDRAIQYITELGQALQSVGTLLKTGNITVDAIFSPKLAKAWEEGIAVTVQAQVPAELLLTDLELSILLGNLLDNALRAAGHADCRTVTVRIYAQNGGELWIVKIQNHYKGELIRTGEGFLTTKEEGGIHGIGIQSVKKTARKYGGDLQCIVEGQLFTAVLLLPNGT